MSSKNSLAILQNSVTAVRSLWGRLLGQPEMYDGNRNINKACGYPEEPTNQEYYWFWKRFGLGKRIINIYPDECWKVSPYIYEDPDPDVETQFEKDLKELDERLSFLSRLHRLDRLSGVGRFGVMYLGFDDVDSVEGVSRPVEGKVKLLFLKVFDETRVEVGQWVTDDKDPRFGLPLAYTITFGEVNATGSGNSNRRTVHWSRVIHFADNCEDSDVYGEPRLRPVYNRLIDLRKIYGGSAEMFWLGARPSIGFEMDPQAKLEAEDVEEMQDEIEKFINDLQPYFKLQGVKANAIRTMIKEPTKFIDAHLQFIATTYEVPVRVFLGSEVGQLAGDKDDEHWNSRVGGRQITTLTPRIIRPTIDRFIEYGVVATPKQYTVEWQDLNTTDSKDRAEVAEIISKAMKDYVESDSARLMHPEIYLRDVVGLSDEVIRANRELIEGFEKDVPDDEDEEDEE